MNNIKRCIARHGHHWAYEGQAQPQVFSIDDAHVRKCCYAAYEAEANAEAGEKQHKINHMHHTDFNLMGVVFVAC